MKKIRIDEMIINKFYKIVNNNRHEEFVGQYTKTCINEYNITNVKILYCDGDNLDYIIEKDGGLSVLETDDIYEYESKEEMVADIL